MLVPMWDTVELNWNDKINYLAYRFSKMDQIPTPVEHTFVLNEYIRTMKIPRGTLFIGRRHIQGHLVSLLEGSCLYFAADGGRYELNAPFTLLSNPGFYACFYAITDMVGETRHPNPLQERNTEALEAAYFEPAARQIERGRVIHDRLSYAEFLKSHGVDEIALQRFVKQTRDTVLTTTGKFSIRQSPIQGLGVFAEKDFRPHEMIQYARIAHDRTELGRYANHSHDPNAYMHSSDGNIVVFAKKWIKTGDEITVDYKEAVRVNLETKVVKCQV